jgi:signal transduction histidine kinase
MFARPPKLKVSQVPARQFVEHVSTLFEGQAQSKGVTFSSQCDADAFIHIDSEQMTQALLNLLQNALEASKKGNSISLGVRSDGENVVFEVADDGVGIPHNALDRIFNLYFTTKSTGTGMGLAICQQIVSQHRGSIEAQSEPGKGTKFTIRIPRGDLS